MLSLARKMTLPRALPQVGAPPDPAASQPVTTHLERRFPGEALDVCISGDTHVEYIASFGGVLCVNPGSATLPCAHHTFRLFTCL